MKKIVIVLLSGMAVAIFCLLGFYAHQDNRTHVSGCLYNLFIRESSESDLSSPEIKRKIAEINASIPIKTEWADKEVQEADYYARKVTGH